MGKMYFNIKELFTMIVYLKYRLIGKLTDICELGTQYSGAMRSFIQSEIIFVGFEPTLVIESAM